MSKTKAVAGSSGGKLPRRPYGRTGIGLSIIGFGGIVVCDVPQEQADRSVRAAIEAGVNYFDVAPTYGNAQERLGPALEPFRDKAFLSCKTTMRDAAGAKRELDWSLELLRTDHFDLYQLHGLEEMAELDQALGKGGAMQTIVEARKAGLVRHIGFSAHSCEVAMAAMERFDFDSLMLPVNFASWYAGDFAPAVLEKAAQKRMGCMALKAMAHRQWPAKDYPTRKQFPKCWYEPVHEPQQASLALRWTLSRKVTVAIPPGEPALFELALKIASDMRPLDDAELARVELWARQTEPLFVNNLSR